MKFNSEVYNKIYHAESADNIGSAGGVVEPQQKDNQKPQEQTEAQKQSDKDININIRVDAGEKPEDEKTAETDKSQPEDNGGEDPTATSESEDE